MLIQPPERASLFQQRRLQELLLHRASLESTLLFLPTSAVSVQKKSGFSKQMLFKYARKDQEVKNESSLSAVGL